MIYQKQYIIRGIVQGVGFRPFIYKIAHEYNLKGWVLNDSNGVTIETEGTIKEINAFIERIKKDAPILATINEITLLKEKQTKGTYKDFTIKESKQNVNRKALISPDTYVCEDCLHELFDHTDRRYRYPFINCTNCGPRYSIIENIPYDRKYTTMKSFRMCVDCEAEYKNVSDRRFHAQPIACWRCGPQITICDKSGKEIHSQDPVEDIVQLIKKGEIVAVKGIGGFHLMVDPENKKAVLKLRKLKHRQHKPLALMCDGIDNAESFCEISEDEKKMLLSKERPIVLLKKKFPNSLPESISPNMNSFGVMLAYTPLHYLLLRNNFRALVCTSANITDEPIVYKNDDAINSLSNIADYFLIHDRDIYTRLDDSIVACNQITSTKVNIGILRRSRGYVPLPFKFTKSFPSGLALGAELKNTICLNKDEKFLSKSTYL